MDDNVRTEMEERTSNIPEQNPKSFSEITHHKFPTTLEGFGYKFNDFGQFRHITTDEPFEFNVRKDNHDYNQQRYEAIGELVTDCIYKFLEDVCGLKKLTIPIDALSQEATTFIFHSEDAFTNDKLVLLIHGSGVVRAGQWARRLILNDGLNSGSQIPFIKRAKGLGYAVIVLNTNDNRVVYDGVSVKIRDSESAESHAKYVWQEVIMEHVQAKHIAVIAHSYGGVVTVNLAQHFGDLFMKRVFAICFTDSVHSLESQILRSPLSEKFRSISRNWVVSQLPLDTHVSIMNKREVECVSAGTQRHDLTSWMAFASIYEFIDQMYCKRMASHSDTPTTVEKTTA